MMRNFMKTVSLMAVLSAAVCNAQVPKPAYEGWSLLAPLPATNSETAAKSTAMRLTVFMKNCASFCHASFPMRMERVFHLIVKWRSLTVSMLFFEKHQTVRFG